MILNETVLSVALPIISQDFQVDATTVQWLTTGFLLVMAVVIPMTGYLLQRFSTRAVFTGALILFTVGTALAAISPTFPVLLFARVLQAVGTAIIVPLLMTVAMTIVPPERRGATMGLIGVVISVAPALGPTVSGVVLSTYTWHALFWIILPIISICLIAGLKFIQNISEQENTYLDIFSIPLSALGFGGLVFGLSQITDFIHSGNSAPLISLTIGALFLVWFIQRQISLGRKNRALLNLQPFRISVFRVSVFAIACSMGIILGTAVILPFFIQQSLGASALLSGLLVLPGGLLQGFASPFVGRLYDRHGARKLALPGAAGVFLTQFGFSTLDSNSPLYMVLILHIILALSMAFIMTPLMTNTLSALPQNLYGHGSAILSTLQQLGGASGTAIFIATMTLADTTANGTSIAFRVGTALGISTFIAVLFIARNNVKEP
ncbi:putative multidrug resistance protein EmrY [Corynebacterium freiburgense]|nr:putative multidrug resistance protein EmrY [Corynebacterium freiburgense]